MEINDFTEKFVACLHHTPDTEINSSTKFKKLEEWSSIFALIVIAMVDSEYGKVLTAEDIHKADTIEDLFGIIQSK
jgi:acyl carrier protein